MKTSLRTTTRQLGLALSVLLTGSLSVPGAWAGGIATDGNVEAEDVIADGMSVNTFATEVCQSLQEMGVTLPADCDAPPPPPSRYVFITSTASPYGGNLTAWANSLYPSQTFIDGLLAGDAICQYHAEDIAFPPLPGTYKAWLSTDYAHAKDRIGDHKWVLLYGAVVADGLQDLLTCSPSCLQNPINLDERGVLVESENPNVFTGTNFLGVGEPRSSNDLYQYCRNWKYSGSVPVLAQFGESDQTNGNWTQHDGFFSSWC